MPEYLVELYSITADPDSAALARLGDRSTVRYLRSILIPGDETCLHLVEADSVERVAEAFEQVGLEADRIVEAVDLQGPAAIDNQRRKS
jgi:Nickel responsive protein SCO4226-like